VVSRPFDYDAIVGGHLCLDVLPDMARVPSLAIIQPGGLVEIGAAGIATGGPVSNTGLALHHLGAKVGLMATVGDDLIGRLILLYLHGIDPGLTQFISVQPKQASSYSVVLAPGEADRAFLHCTGTNATFGPEHIDFGELSRARVFHFGYPPLLPRLIVDAGEPLRTVFERAKAQGVVTSLETSLPDRQSGAGRADWQAILRNALPFVDIFVPSIEEILFMLRRADFDAWEGDLFAHLTRSYLSGLAAELIGMGIGVTGFKLGTYGLYLRAAAFDRLARLDRLHLNKEEWANFEGYLPALQVEVSGTTGAGDAAYAGLLMALLRGFAPMEAMRWACAVGACCVEAVDAVSGIRSWAETAQRLAQDWPARPERLSG
jgi:sugar/nucleoside kinase (ribokinase family)